MQTLYDLLGALPSDDAEGLRTAFRKAVKGAHPDIHPDDPDAAMRFRQIVRANDILIDDEQRAAYDHLLDLARLEQVSESRHAVAAKVHKLASGVLALAGVSVVTVGGYLLFLHMSAAALAPANKMDVAMRASAAIAAVRPVTSPDAAGKSTSSAQPESAGVSAEAIASSVVVPGANEESVSVVDVGLVSDSNSFRARGVFASRNGEPTGASAEPGQATDPDPAASAADIDRGNVFYRSRRIDRAFADITRARRIEKASHSRYASTMAGKPRLNQAVLPPSLTPLPRQRPPMRDLSREEGFASAMR
jgi:curved DNA-binding protein CbpA